MANKPIDKLLNLLKSNNIAAQIDDEEQIQIVGDVLSGYRIDEDSRANWLEANQEAMKIIKHCEDDTDQDSLDTPIYKQAKVVFSLIDRAVIQLASRLIQQIVRNDSVAGCKILGQDELVPENPQEAEQYQQAVQQNPQLQQQLPPPKMVWRKKERANRVSKFLSWELLIDSDSWLKDTHKLCHILASWGTAFRQVSYDPVSKRVCEELIPPEDVIINHNLSSLDKARRITIKHYLTVNDIIEQQRSGYFSDVDLDLLKTSSDDTEGDTNPVHTVLCQFGYKDLDGDGYAEPYKFYVHEKLNKLLGVYPAFEYSDIRVSDTGEILRISPRIDVVDYHLIDDPEGKFYSLGLNYLLLHQNKSLTAILRQLIDAGSIKNAGSSTGFITSAFKTKEQDLQFELGTYKKVDINPMMQGNPQQHIIPLPVGEPSQVLYALFEFLVQSGEKTGLITDVLTGDTSGQNVPATTMLAMIEQGTRAFKPVIQKFWSSLKRALKLRCHLHYIYLEDAKYASFQDTVVQVTREDFNDQDLDISPVADPTQSSEAHHYAKMQFIIQMLATPAAGAMNLQENLRELYKGLEFDEPERFLAPPPDPSQNPDMIELQIKAKDSEHKQMMDQLKAENDKIKTELAKIKTQQNQQKIDIDRYESMVSTRATSAQAHNAAVQAVTQSRMADVQEEKLSLEEKKLDLMDKKLDVEKAKINKPKSE